MARLTRIGFRRSLDPATRRGLPMRHWTINGRFLAQPRTGVQRYAREIVRGLDQALVGDRALAADLRLEIVAPPDADDAFTLEAIPVRKVGRYGGHLWEQTVLPRHAPDGLLCLCNTGPVAHHRQIVCIHDMTPRACPESYSLGFRSVYRVLLPALGRGVAAVATVSEYSAGEIARAGIRRRETILVIPNGHDHVARWTPDTGAPGIAGFGRDTIVLIGSVAPHKNIRLVIGLADRLAEIGLRVAVVGTTDPRLFRHVEQRSAPNVAWLGRLPDDALAGLLGNCLCLAFPSLTEGFGLPPLEAMALGCAVVASDRASIPEVCGEAVLYAPPDDPDAWFRCFQALAASDALRAGLAARGRAQAGRFLWRVSAARYLAAMAAVDGVPLDRAA